ncbi:hypothetical protein RclHR1_17730004 [Rhizophagus clarus]|uniref:Uncharacterized protein n=1 Tax=Rhizophagus clarus TaxID=94130 RepID=A0A2Z6QKN4_9GLOM|nr:hypothetical protein RclHR1_17730004 [Rhizophagus clarus]
MTKVLVWNTEHTDSDSISKNSNLKQTEVFEGPELHFEADHFQNSFRGGLVQTFHFEDWTLFEVWSSGRSEYFEGSCFLHAIVKRKWKNDEEKSLLNKISKIHSFPDAF